MSEKYKTKQEVHNRAVDAVGKPMIELNGGKKLTGKSGPGDAFENWFGKPKDSLSEPDLREAQVELKATPIKKLKRGNQYSAKERLVLNIINYDTLAKEDFETSHFLHKNKTIELGFYEYQKDIPKDDWTFKKVALYTMQNNPNDFAVIKRDWEKIKQYVMDGKADQLSEGISEYLAPCTKGANAKSMRTQPYSSTLAKQRAFSLKSGYMTHLLRTYILGSEDTESIFKGRFELEHDSLYDAILKKLNRWQGSSVSDLKNRFGIRTKAKSVNFLLASKMLGLEKGINSSDKSNQVTEFEKANIIMKTVKFNEKGHNQESMSFRAFSFKKLAKETWVDSEGVPTADWHKFLLETTFLFLVFQEIDGIETFMGAKFFSVPERDINGKIRDVWQDTVNKIKAGVKLTAKVSNSSKSGYVIANNFIKKSDKMICHVRPHTNHADYSVGGKDANQLPTPIQWTNRPDMPEIFSDDWMTIQCFWLNNDYIKSQLLDLVRQ